MKREAPIGSSWLTRSLQLVILLYLFLVFIALIGASFKLLGRDLSEALVTATSSPVVSLLAGMLATALIQSSSTTTSLIVGLVAAEAVSVRGAVPMIMGANIGTTVTNTLVATAAMSRREEFRRAYAGATMHDFFNVISVLLLLPLELSTHFLERSATAAATLLVGRGEVEFSSPIKTITKPVAKAFVHQLETWGMADASAGVVTLVLALGGIFLVLHFLPRLLKEMFLSRAQGAFFRVMNRGGPGGIATGTFLTVLVQSSSITTSLLIPMVGAGILSLEGAFAMTLGANIGTTVTALLASTAGTHGAVTIALVHLYFNLTGIILLYPIPGVRRIPIRLAQKLADWAVQRKWVPLAYLAILFFLLPGIVIFIQRLLTGS